MTRRARRSGRILVTLLLAVTVAGDGLKIPNPQYVRNVRALMTECECLSF